MSESKHTPGPWSISGDIIVGAPEQPPNPKADLRYRTVCKLGWDFDGDCNPTGDLPWAIAKENARLIAAAPEAVDFLIQYLWSEHGICAAEDDAAPHTPEELRDMAQAILAKAKGDA